MFARIVSIFKAEKRFILSSIPAGYKPKIKIPAARIDKTAI